MVASGEVLVRTEASAESRGAVGNRLVRSCQTPVTVCHIETGASRGEEKSGEAGSHGAPLQGSLVHDLTSSQGIALGCDRAHPWCSLRGNLRSAGSETRAEQRARDERRGLMRPLWLLDDNSAALADRTTTLGDIDGQVLGLRINDHHGVFRWAEVRPSQFHSTEKTLRKRLMAIRHPPMAGCNPCLRSDGIGTIRRKCL